MSPQPPIPGSAERLHEYWVHGGGAAKIRWGEPGDFDRCTRELMDDAHFTPEQAHGYCNLAHHAALGFYPATHAAMEKGHHGGSHRMSIYTRSFPLEDISIRAGGDGRTVDAYIAVFDQPAEVHDRDGDYEETIDPAAFNRALEHARRARGGWNIPVIFNHGMTLYGTPSERDSMPIGITEDIRPDGRGLRARSRYSKTIRADEALEGIRDGSITAYSFGGAFLRSDPMVPRGGFRDRAGKLPSVRRMESSLREYGPTPFPIYQGAEIIGVRAEQAALVLSNLAPGEFDRLTTFFRSGTPIADPPEQGTPDDSGPAAGDPPQPRPLWHSVRSPREIIQANRAAWILAAGEPK